MKPQCDHEVFCAIDDQVHSGRAADTAIKIARTMSSMLIFFIVNPAVLPGRGPMIYLWNKDYIDGYFTQARARARQSGVYDTKCITKNASNIARAILVEAQNEGADYIVVGSNCRPGPFGNWKHSITREIAAKAPAQRLLFIVNCCNATWFPDFWLLNKIITFVCRLGALCEKGRQNPGQLDCSYSAITRQGLQIHLPAPRRTPVLCTVVMRMGYCTDWRWLAYRRQSVPPPAPAISVRVNYWHPKKITGRGCTFGPPTLIQLIRTFRNFGIVGLTQKYSDRRE